MKRAAIVALLAIAACSKRAPAPVAGEQHRPHLRPVGEKPPDDSADRVSLINLAHGSTVTFRTGEALLDVSALRAIDGDPTSCWMTPAHDLPQSMIIALPAGARIEKVGIRTDEGGEFTATHVQLDRSVDGTTFVPLTTIVSADSRDAQWFNVTPAEASHLRVTIVDAWSAGHDVRLYSVLARGSELEAPHNGDIGACWVINGSRARFLRKGAHAIGILELGHEPLHFDGGFDGRIYRLNWIRGNDYGLALITVSPDSRHLSGIEWHEEAIPMFYGDSWFGERRDCSGSNAFDAATPVKLLHRTGRYSLFGIRFRDDGSIDSGPSAETLSWLTQFLADAPEARLVAHEFRQPNGIANRAFAQRELNALRAELERSRANLAHVAFVNQGSDAPRQLPVSEPMRALYSTIDLEIRR